MLGGKRTTSGSDLLAELRTPCSDGASRFALVLAPNLGSGSAKRTLSRMSEIAWLMLLSPVLQADNAGAASPNLSSTILSNAINSW